MGIPQPRNHPRPTIVPDRPPFAALALPAEGLGPSSSSPASPDRSGPAPACTASRRRSGTSRRCPRRASLSRRRGRPASRHRSSGLGRGKLVALPSPGPTSSSKRRPKARQDACNDIHAFRAPCRKRQTQRRPKASPRGVPVQVPAERCCAAASPVFFQTSPERPWPAPARAKPPMPRHRRQPWRRRRRRPQSEYPRPATDPVLLRGRSHLREVHGSYGDLRRRFWAGSPMKTMHMVPDAAASVFGLRRCRPPPDRRKADGANLKQGRAGAGSAPIPQRA